MTRAPGTWLSPHLPSLSREGLLNVFDRSCHVLMASGEPSGVQFERRLDEHHQLGSRSQSHLSHLRDRTRQAQVGEVHGHDVHDPADEARVQVADIGSFQICHPRVPAQCAPNPPEPGVNCLDMRRTGIEQCLSEPAGGRASSSATSPFVRTPKTSRGAPT